MSAQLSACFYGSACDLDDSKISFRQHIQNGLDHVFNSVRHTPYDDTVDEKTVNYWLGRDPFSAAVQVVMLQKDHDLSKSSVAIYQEPLIQTLVDIQKVTLQDVQSRSSGSEILASPLLCQLLVCTALQYGNRGFVRDLIKNFKPGLAHNQLFSPKTMPSGPGFHKFFDDIIIDGETDSGTNLYNNLIMNRWARPRGYMQVWAALSPDVQSGIEFIEILSREGCRIDERAALNAVASGHLAMLQYLLSMRTPEDHIVRHKMLKYAAARRPDGRQYLQTLFDHGIKEINWMPPPPNSLPHPRDQLESEALPETPLHKASECGEPTTVEWLINHGAERLKNHYGQDQVESAKAWARHDNLFVFQKHAGWELVEAKQKSGCCCML